MKPLALEDLQYVYARASRTFDHLTGAEIVITGANGFIGSWLADSGSTLDHNAPRPRRFTRQNSGDIRQITLPTGTTHVIHSATAGSHHDNQHRATDVVDMIIAGTARVAGECKRVGARLLLMSSGSVYAPNPAGRYSETESRRLGSNSLESAFALAKTLAEDSARSLNDNTVIARGFAMLGPRLPQQFAAAEFMAQALSGGPLRVAGSGNTTRSYLHAADVAAILWHLLAFGEAGQAYNVGSDSPTTIGTLACHTAHLAGLDPDRAIKWGTAGKDSAPFVPDTTKLRNLMGPDWAPPLTPYESLERWIAWEKA